MPEQRRIDPRWLILGAVAAVAIALNYQRFAVADFARMLQIPLHFLILFPAIILHEVSHGYVAYLLGDPTAFGNAQDLACTRSRALRHPVDVIGVDREGDRPRPRENGCNSFWTGF